MATIKLAGNGIGGIVQGAFGTYQAGSDLAFTVDVRDAPQLLAMGMTYLANRGDSYTVPKAPLAATVGQIVASATLSNGAASIANQPDVMRQVAVEVSAGTVAITAGTVTIVYTGSDMQAHTDVMSLVLPASGSFTNGLSRGAVSITSVTVAGLVGGATPFIRLNTTALLAVPSDPLAQNFAMINEIDDTTRQTAPGTFSGSSLGCTTVVTAPNGTHTYSVAYAYVSPNV